VVSSLKSVLRAFCRKSNKRIKLLIPSSFYLSCWFYIFPSCLVNCWNIHEKCNKIEITHFTYEEDFMTFNGFICFVFEGWKEMKGRKANAESN
jgi:hypothetical protein